MTTWGGGTYGTAEDRGTEEGRRLVGCWVRGEEPATAAPVAAFGATLTSVWWLLLLLLWLLLLEARAGEVRCDRLAGLVEDLL